MFGSPDSFVALVVVPDTEPLVPEIACAAANMSFGGACCWIVQAQFAGVGSMFPAVSIARTEKV